MSDEILKSIHEKVDKIADDMVDIKITQAKQQVSLDEHIKRSNMLEELFLDMKEKDIEPIQENINQLRGAYKLVVFGVSLLSVIFGILKFLGKI